MPVGTLFVTNPMTPNGRKYFRYLAKKALGSESKWREIESMAKSSDPKKRAKYKALSEKHVATYMKSKKSRVSASRKARQYMKTKIFGKGKASTKKKKPARKKNPADVALSPVGDLMISNPFGRENPRARESYRAWITRRTKTLKRKGAEPARALAIAAAEWTAATKGISFEEAFANTKFSKKAGPPPVGFASPKKHAKPKMYKRRKAAKRKTTKHVSRSRAAGRKHLSPWQQFMKKHRGQGYSSAQLAAMFRASPEYYKGKAGKRRGSYTPRYMGGGGPATQDYSWTSYGWPSDNAPSLVANPRRNPQDVVSMIAALPSRIPYVGRFANSGWIETGIYAGAAGAAHYFIGRQTGPALEAVGAKIGEFTGQIPVVGEYLSSENLSNAFGTAAYTITGTAVRAAAGIAGRYIPANRYVNASTLEALGNAALILGVGIDAYRHFFVPAVVEEIESQGATAGVGNLAVGNLAMGNLALGDGMAYELGAVSLDNLGDVEYARATDMGGLGEEYGNLAMGDVEYGNLALGDVEYGNLALAGLYGDAQPEDARYCQPDMNPQEAAAFAQGPAAVARTFGLPPASASRAQTPHSRHAGRPGHQFGWAVKALGWERMAKLARLSPAKRRQTLAQAQAAAIRAADQSIAANQHATLLLPQEDVPSMGAFGVQGTGGAQGISGYGAVLFGGDGA